MKQTVDNNRLSVMKLRSLLNAALYFSICSIRVYRTIVWKDEHVLQGARMRKSAADNFLSLGLCNLQETSKPLISRASD